MDELLVKVFASSKARFCRSYQQSGYDQQTIDACWTWAENTLDKFELMNGANQADINERVISFSTRRVQELRIARYLTKYGTDEGPSGRPKRLECNAVSRGSCLGQRLESSHRMPQTRVDRERYRSAIKLLFERPPQVKDSRTMMERQFHRRPSELMSVAVRWIRRQRGIAGFRDELLRELGRQFKEIYEQVTKTGTTEQKQVLEELMNPQNYVFFAELDKKHKTANEEGDVCEIEMPFGIGKSLINNAQFLFFDDNFAEAEFEVSRLQQGTQKIA